VGGTSAAALALAIALLPSSGRAATVADDVLIFSGNAETLTGNHGGGGGSATWMRKFDTGSLFGFGAEHQTIYTSNWTLGSFNGVLAVSQGSIKNSLYVEAHLGAGDAAGAGFHYVNAAGGVLSTLTPWLTTQLEERYIDIQENHGHLPKLGLIFRVAPKALATVSYAQSFGGNLDTKLGTARVDYAGAQFSWLFGGAYGPVSPSILDLIGQVLRPAQTLKEGFAGLGKSFGRSDWQLLGDYQDLEGIKRTTITLNCTVHLGPRGPAR
jgi:hypothetical protein